ncbi:hypothetical transcript [Echinococcus multilocularis]|uniref:Hypothetical transcript n=1 Tax=Echinococcus multilocularis TaxID=6211 RepID=A0A0S4MLS5_ECHMU|nr:hypothetical transcript [Echinococcus multilocularis]
MCCQKLDIIWEGCGIEWLEVFLLSQPFPGLALDIADLSFARIVVETISEFRAKKRMMKFCYRVSRRQGNYGSNQVEVTSVDLLQETKTNMEAFRIIIFLLKGGI